MLRRMVANGTDSTKNRCFAYLHTGSFYCGSSSSCHGNARVAGTHMAGRVPPVAKRHPYATRRSRKGPAPELCQRPFDTSFCDFADWLLLRIVLAHLLCDWTCSAEGICVVHAPLRCAQISTPPREARVGDPGSPPRHAKRASGTPGLRRKEEISFCAFTARLKPCPDTCFPCGYEVAAVAEFRNGVANGVESHPLQKTNPKVWCTYVIVR
jgi:hypothetical protein